MRLAELTTVKIILAAALVPAAAGVLTMAASDESCTCTTAPPAPDVDASIHMERVDRVHSFARPPAPPEPPPPPEPMLAPVA